MVKFYMPKHLKHMEGVNFTMLMKLTIGGKCCKTHSAVMTIVEMGRIFRLVLSNIMRIFNHTEKLKLLPKYIHIFVAIIQFKPI